MSKLLFPATVVNNEDPMMLGRIRAYPLDQNIESALKGYNFQEGKDEFTEKDPFVVLPLLPMFLSQVPLVNERVSVILQNSDRPFQDAYYVQGAYSSPMTFPFENAQAANKNTSLGYRIKQNLALKNNNGQLKKPTKTFGVFPELDDVSVLGRGTSDIIVKPNGVLIRAGKTFDLKVNKFPVANEKKAFIQVSSFDSRIVPGKSQDLVKFNTLNKQVNYLIEWNVYNLENTQNSFTGDVILYKLKQNEATTTDKISYNSDLTDFRFLVFSQPFQALTIENAIQFINVFINRINDGVFPNGTTMGNERFPFVYRPSQNIRELLQPGNPDIGDPVIFSNAAKFIGGITLNAGTGPNSYNFGLVSSSGTLGKPSEVQIETLTPKKVESVFGTFMINAADTLIMMSHRYGNITFDPKLSPNPNTMMGISQQQLEENVIPNTYPMVRGDILFDYLEKISSFLQNHVHSHANLPPSALTWNGDSKRDLFSYRWRFKALNEEIRIN